MTAPTNVLQQVITYQMAELAFMQNYSAFISTANTRFKNFQNETANLGTTVNFELPPRMTTTNSLVAVFQAAAQRVQSLTVDQQISTSFEFNVQEFIFNVQDYMERFGKAAVKEIASNVEAQVGTNGISHTYRFYGDGTTAINSYGQLASMLAFFRNYGTPGDEKVYLTDMMIPGIINSGLNQFALDRNNEEAQSWMVGNFDKAMFLRSNLLPIHTSGTVGTAQQTMTVVSTNDPTGVNITQITLSGATANDANAFKLNDLIQFQDGVSGQPNLRYLTFVGHQPSANPVQCRVTADAGADGSGNVTISIYPALCSQSSNQNQNIANNIVAGMQLKAVTSHRAAFINAGNSLFLAMPRLPEEVPFPTANASDPETGVSLRSYYGSLFAQNERGYVHDAIWGSTMVDENSMRICVPL